MKGLNQDVPAFQDAISERLGAFVHNLAVFVVGLAIGRLKNIFLHTANKSTST